MKHLGKIAKWSAFILLLLSVSTTLQAQIGATISDCEKHFRFHRRKGTSGTLLNCDEAQIQDGALSAFLRELDRERFEQFFGLNHQRLGEGGEELLRARATLAALCSRLLACWT